MKKTLLLSVVASTLIMAGGDIEPVAVPVVEEVVSGWDFSGQAVVYYQTNDAADLFDQASSKANAGLQLRAVNKDIAWGIGAGAEVTGVATLGLENDVVSDVMQTANQDMRGGWISQAYLTYGFGNTSLKAGRQELPKSLSPFAFSEGWNVFKNTFDAVLVVNTDIADTTIVGAWVEGGNYNGAASGLYNGFASNSADMANFQKANGGAGVYMLTVQNKSVANLTLTGSWYYAPDFANNNGVAAGTEDANILWADVKYAMDNIAIAGQIGTVMDDDFDKFNQDDVVAYGAKIGGNFGMFDASLAYSGVNDGGVTVSPTRPKGIFNVGGIKTPLYTQMIFNQNAIRTDNDTFVARAGVKALGGKFGLAYDYTSDNSAAANDYTELDLTYKTKVFADTTTLFVGYIYQDADNTGDANTIRVWGRYNF